MTTSICRSVPISVTATLFGLSWITDVNNWNDTVFSRPCPGKFDDEFLALIHSDKLDLGKHDIALKKLAETHGGQL